MIDSLLIVRVTFTGFDGQIIFGLGEDRKGISFLFESLPSVVCSKNTVAGTLLSAGLYIASSYVLSLLKKKMKNLRVGSPDLETKPCVECIY